MSELHLTDPHFSQGSMIVFISHNFSETLFLIDESLIKQTECILKNFTKPTWRFCLLPASPSSGCLPANKTLQKCKMRDRRQGASVHHYLKVLSTSTLKCHSL